MFARRLIRFIFSIFVLVTKTKLESKSMKIDFKVTISIFNKCYEIKREQKNFRNNIIHEHF